MEINKPYIQKQVINVDIIVHMKNQSLNYGFKHNPLMKKNLRDSKKKKNSQNRKNIVYLCHCHRHHDPLTKTGNKRIKMVQYCYNLCTSPNPRNHSRRSVTCPGNTFCKSTSFLARFLALRSGKGSES